MTLKPLTGKVSNASHLDPMQCSAGKGCILGLAWFHFDTYLHISADQSSPTAIQYDNTTPLMSSFLQMDSTKPWKNSLRWA